MNIIGFHSERIMSLDGCVSRSAGVSGFPALFRAGCAVLLCSLLLFTGCSSNSDAIARTQDLYNRGELEAAALIARTIPKDSASWPEAQYLLGRIETSLHGPDVALPYFDSVPRDGSPLALRSVASAAQLEYQRCRLSVAIKHYELICAQSKTEMGIHATLANMFAISGQRSMAEPHLFEVLKKGKVQLKQLVWFSAPERVPDSEQYLKICRETNSSDHLVQLGIAAEEMKSQKQSSAKDRLVNLLRTHPELADAHAMLGELYLDASQQELERWNAAIPVAIQDHPEIWYVRGQWARRMNQSRVAARCFWETIRHSATHQRAMYQLGQIVSPLEPDVGAAFSERAQKLKEYTQSIESVMIQQGRDEQLFKHITALLIEMGRDWEAWVWANLACDMAGRNGWPLELLNSLEHVPTMNPSRTRHESDLALKHDLSAWPGFDTLRTPTATESRPSVRQDQSNAFKFEDQAAELGIGFTYFQSHNRDSHGVRMFESTGGGTAVIDYDLDGWPDLFLTQGVEWPLGADHPAPSDQFHDQLYRNRGHRFENTTNFSLPEGEEGYGQGCSAGDFDNDGFPDLYIANIGANQLLRNNGDGTFSDISRSASISGEAWTTSCLIADLNADGNPDLYDVNYLQGEHIFSIECSASRCSVRNYQGAPDQVQLSRGDGTFETVPDATPKANAKGLGIVLFHVDQEPMPSLFIANDQVPNFFLRPTSSNGTYTNEGPLRGLAVNMYGQATASMGVAAGDVNHDGMLDLFVTNFEGEAKNLFLQREHGFFDDSIFGSGIMSAGIPFVGWGTQFLDADNDGELDLVVTNGHIADFHEKGVEYRMPIQFFQSVGPARFAQISAASAGELFERNLFGRSLATFDWNRDGRTDFVVSCIESPAIVATSRCQTSHHWLNVRLSARMSARDAIGAVVEVHAGSTQSSRQMIAGDGYQASNERILHFGLSHASSVDRVIVRWPSGNTSIAENVPLDTTIHLIEGKPFVIDAP